VGREYDLERFVRAQDAGDAYAAALVEIANGKKSSHWIWYVFPQVVGLGVSDTSRHYAVANLDEARAFLAHPVLGRRLREITSLVAQNATKTARDIFSNDDVKFHSCMTLFCIAAPEEAVFREALVLFFDGEPDEMTLAVLSAHDGVQRDEYQ
jgi:uncharacterized protein (DUF1810 family)